MRKFARNSVELLYKIYATYIRQIYAKQKQSRGFDNFLIVFDCMEARGVEPLSESALAGTSPGADGYLHSLAQTQAVMLKSLVASLNRERRTENCQITGFPRQHNAER